MTKLARKLAVLVTVLASAATVNAQTNTTIDEEPQIYRRSNSAGFYVEPLVNYTRQDSSIRGSQLGAGLGDTTAVSQGAGLGVKVGGHINEAFLLGVDARYNRVELSDSSYGDANGNFYTLGPTLAFQMPWAGVRVFGTYVALGEYNPDAGNAGLDARFSEPRGGRVGIGFHIGRISFNLEYEDLQFDNTDIQAAGVGGTGPTGLDFDTRGYTASLSFPMEL